MHPPNSPDSVELPAFIGEPLRHALDGIDVPMYVVDRGGALRWTNRAASRILGRRVGESFLALVPPDVRDSVGAQLLRSVVGGETTVHDVAVTAADGARIRLRARSAPIRDAGRNVAVFTLALPLPRSAAAATTPAPALTPRQTEVLQLLADGLSTEAMAERLGVATETVRNHVRAVLHRLDSHSRLEAVVEARRRGLLDD